MQPKQHCLQLHTYMHLLKISLQGFSAALQPDCEIRNNCGKNKVSRARATCMTRVLSMYVVFDWFVLSMCMQVILNLLNPLFARPGLAPYMGREERRVQGLDYTTNKVDILICAQNARKNFLSTKLISQKLIP